MHARAGHVNLSLVAGSLALAAVAAQPVSGSAAPAVITGGDADVIAHGVHEFVPGEYHWIVGAATLEDGASAPISTGGLTLLVQNDGVVDATSGDDSERLDEGSASLLRPDAESVVNATSGPSAYWTLSILNVEITGEMNATQFTLDQNLYNVKLYRTITQSRRFADHRRSRIAGVRVRHGRDHQRRGNRL